MNHLKKKSQLIFQSFCDKFFPWSLERIDSQELDMGWQTIEFLHGIIGVGFKVLVGQVTCIVKARG
jgi:hypothetical protein